MGVKTNFTQNDIDRIIARKIQAIELTIINTLAYMGEECVNRARAEGEYTDQTGNLRSSIGYVVVAHGKVVYRSTFGSFGKEGGAKGQQQGREFLESLISKYLHGYALIVVAGMNYASYVESNGKNVLSTAQHYAQRELPRMLNKLRGQVRRSAL